MDENYEKDELDLLVERCGGKLELADVGFTIGEDMSPYLENSDVSLDDVVARNGGKLELADVGFYINDPMFAQLDEDLAAIETRNCGKLEMAR